MFKLKKCSGYDGKGHWDLQTSWISLLHDVDEWEPDTSFQHHDACDRDLPATF